MIRTKPIEKLYCALLFLLTRRACAPPPELAAMIGEHLKCLADHPDTRDLPLLRDTCRRLAAHWPSRPGAKLASSRSAAARQRRSELH
jgi:hypothetical protein